MSHKERPPMRKAAATGQLLRELLQQWGLESKLREHAAWQVWDEVVGPQIAARARPARIREGVLEVRVDQAVWMQQLQLLKPKILVRLNERLGAEIIRDIFWRRGRVEQETVAAPELKRPPLSPLPPEEVERIRKIVAPLPDSELRMNLQRILLKQAQIDLSNRKS